MYFSLRSLNRQSFDKDTKPYLAFDFDFCLFDSNGTKRDITDLLCYCEKLKFIFRQPQST